MNKLARRSDLLLIMIVFLMALAFILPRYFGAEDKLVASIYVDGELNQSIDLSSVDEAYTISVNNTVIEVDINEIRFRSSDCKDRLCVNTGKLTRDGSVAACLPNRVLITVTDGEKGNSNGLDAITY